MDMSNLARVFGPTIVGHAVPDPDPMTILQDTKRQAKVGLNNSSRSIVHCVSLVFTDTTPLRLKTTSLRIILALNTH